MDKSEHFGAIISDGESILIEDSEGKDTKVKVKVLYDKSDIFFSTIELIEDEPVQKKVRFGKLTLKNLKTRTVDDKIMDNLRLENLVLKEAAKHVSDLTGFLMDNFPKLEYVGKDCHLVAIDILKRYALDKGQSISRQEPYGGIPHLDYKPCCDKGENGKSGLSCANGINSFSQTIHCCPVCGGNGLVSAGFYSVVLGCSYVGTSASPEQCRSCEGKGIIILPLSA